MALYAVRYDVHFTPREPIEVPGFTVKFLKSLIITHDSGDVVKSLILEGGANKPIHLSPIMTSGKPLLSTSTVKLVPGVRYWFRLGTVCDEAKLPILNDFVMGLVEKFAEPLGIEVVSNHLEVLVNAPREFSVSILTPAVIKAKDSTLVKYPTLKELISSPIRVLGRALWEKYSINIPTTWTWRISSYYVMTHAENRSLRVDMGDGRVVEGVVGRWGFRRVAKMPKYLEAVLAKALAVANAVGVGKSRAIGFGMTNITISKD